VQDVKDGIFGLVSDRDFPQIRRTDIRSGDTVGVVMEPDGGSDSFAVVLGGSIGGIPEPLAGRVAACGITAFALGYFGAPGLPSALVEIPLELPERGIELFRDRYASGRHLGLVGTSKGAELALLLASQLPDAIGPTVAIAPSCVAWYGVDLSDLASMRRSSWTLSGAPWPFLPLPEGRMPAFTDQGMRTDSCYDLSSYQVDTVDAARIPIEQARGPILLLSGDDDHQWPAASMAGELTRRMERNGRSSDITSVVYPGAGHVFVMREFLPPPGSPGSPPFDFGGDAEADSTAAQDAWTRIAALLTR
jgi:dienelactone hydrolase